MGFINRSHFHPLEVLHGLIEADDGLGSMSLGRGGKFGRDGAAPDNGVCEKACGCPCSKRNEESLNERDLEVEIVKAIEDQAERESGKDDEEEKGKLFSGRLDRVESIENLALDEAENQVGD